jgi:2-polyprenyl-3-methyl-5-hydroxy-6-metoxy-1,4-benzoquinol methylase
MLNKRETLIADLAHYTGLPVEEVSVRLTQTQDVPDQWIREYGHNARQPVDYHRFYTFNWLYLFDLANFAEQYRPSLANADKYAKGRCLDYGSGIGTVAVDLAMKDEVASVDTIDICIITQDFLKFRKKKYGLDKITVLDPTDNEAATREPHISLKGEYDFIYARDVLEHCWNRVQVVEELCKHVAMGGVIVEATPIDYIGENDGWENIRKQPYDLWDVLEDRGFVKIESEWTGGFSRGETNVWRRDV